tara:strand:+ start:64 stop:1023 length:960 start_codon:yes stop_codon:yes gene_type:complete
MAEVEQVEVHSASHMRNQARINKDEAELRELLKEAGYTQEDETQEEPVEAEAEPDSKEPEAEPVQAEGDTKQEEEPKAEAQEADDDDDDLSAEEKTFKQRYGDIRRHMKDKEEEWKRKFDKLEAQLQSAAKNELVLPKSEKEIEAWSKKYPDVAGIVEAIADKKAQERSSDIDKRLKEVEELRVTAKREKAEAELAVMHPDFNTIREDDSFHEWAKEQPKWVQDALYENVDDAKSVSRVIDLYKSDKGITNKTKKPSEDKNAAASVTTKRTTTPNASEETNYLRESQVAKMSIKEYEKRQEEIMDAQRNGKFIYDVSRK